MTTAAAADKQYEFMVELRLWPRRADQNPAVEALNWHAGTTVRAADAQLAASKGIAVIREEAEKMGLPVWPMGRAEANVTCLSLAQ